MKIDEDCQDTAAEHETEWHLVEHYVRDVDQPQLRRLRDQAVFRGLRTKERLVQRVDCHMAKG